MVQERDTAGFFAAIPDLSTPQKHREELEKLAKEKLLWASQFSVYQPFQPKATTVLDIPNNAQNPQQLLRSGDLTANFQSLGNIASNITLNYGVIEGNLSTDNKTYTGKLDVVAAANAFDNTVNQVATRFNVSQATIPSLEPTVSEAVNKLDGQTIDLKSNAKVDVNAILQSVGSVASSVYGDAKSAIKIDNRVSDGTTSDATSGLHLQVFNINANATINDGVISGSVATPTRAISGNVDVASLYQTIQRDVPGVISDPKPAVLTENSPSGYHVQVSNVDLGAIASTVYKDTKSSINVDTLPITPIFPTTEASNGSIFQTLGSVTKPAIDMGTAVTSTAYNDLKSAIGSVATSTDQNGFHLQVGSLNANATINDGVISGSVATPTRVFSGSAEVGSLYQTIQRDVPGVISDPKPAVLTENSPSGYHVQVGSVDLGAVASTVYKDAKSSINVDTLPITPIIPTTESSNGSIFQTLGSVAKPALDVGTAVASSTYNDLKTSIGSVAASADQSGLHLQVGSLNANATINDGVISGSVATPTKVFSGSAEVGSLYQTIQRDVPGVISDPKPAVLTENSPSGYHVQVGSVDLGAVASTVYKDAKSSINVDTLPITPIIPTTESSNGSIFQTLGSVAKPAIDVGTAVASSTYNDLKTSIGSVAASADQNGLHLQVGSLNANATINDGVISGNVSTQAKSYSGNLDLNAGTIAVRQSSSSSTDGTVNQAVQRVDLPSVTIDASLPTRTAGTGILSAVAQTVDWIPPKVQPILSSVEPIVNQTVQKLETASSAAVGKVTNDVLPVITNSANSIPTVLADKSNPSIQQMDRPIPTVLANIPIPTVPADKSIPVIQTSNPIPSILASNPIPAVLTNSDRVIGSVTPKQNSTPLASDALTIRPVLAKAAEESLHITSFEPNPPSKNLLANQNTVHLPELSMNVDKLIASSQKFDFLTRPPEAYHVSPATNFEASQIPAGVKALYTVANDAHTLTPIPPSNILQSLVPLAKLAPTESAATPLKVEVLAPGTPVVGVANSIEAVLAGKVLAVNATENVTPGKAISANSAETVIAGKGAVLNQTEAALIGKAVVLNPIEGVIPGKPVGVIPNEGVIPGKAVGVNPIEGVVPGKAVGVIPTEGVIPGKVVGVIPTEGVITGKAIGGVPTEGVITGKVIGGVPAEGVITGKAIANSVDGQIKKPNSVTEGGIEIKLPNNTTIGRIPGVVAPGAAGDHDTNDGEHISEAFITGEEERYLPGLEIAAILAFGAISKVRDPQFNLVEAENALALIEHLADIDDSQDNSGRTVTLPGSRREYIISAGETLDGIAKQIFGDERIGWLIAELNKHIIKESSIENKAVFEIESRQRLVLPMHAEVDTFKENKKIRPVEDMVTIITERHIHKEATYLMLEKAMGLTQTSKVSSPATVPAPTPAVPKRATPGLVRQPVTASAVLVTAFLIQAILQTSPNIAATGSQSANTTTC